MGKVNMWRCRDCSSVLETPLLCVGNHECVKCEFCRSENIEIIRDDSDIDR